MEDGQLDGKVSKVIIIGLALMVNLLMLRLCINFLKILL